MKESCFEPWGENFQKGEDMKLSQIRKVSVIGAGIMGHGFAQIFAQKGYSVSLYDIDENILKSALARIGASLDTFIEHGMIRAKEKKPTLERIAVTTELDEAVSQADFVLEAVPEIMDLKKEIFVKLDRFAPPHAILASNTSGLSITQMGSVTQRPEKTIIVHGINPPTIIPVVEIVRGEKTSDETAELCCRLLLKLGKTPVRVLKEVPGFLFNRLQLALWREALHCLENGVATAEDIDNVVKSGYGFRLANLGPLETSDFGGLDTFYRLAQNLFPDLSAAQSAPAVVEKLVQGGKLGLKTGEGFYPYPPAVAKKKIKLRDQRLLQQLKLFMSRGRKG
jgi:3-hydroxybutyryl-CoA dehydrogenase